MKAGILAFICAFMLTVALVSGYTYRQAINKYDDEEPSTLNKRSPRDNKALKSAGGSPPEDTCGCQCHMGPAGIPGIPGNHGQPGANGIQGRDGHNGEKGDAGDRGLPGVDGQAGPIGPVGRRGKQGDKGTQGHVGVPGPIGMKGDRGFTGIHGGKGDKGDKCSPMKKIAFSVARSSRLGPVLQETTITFDNIFTNIGRGFDELTSHFVCRVNGTYLFTTHLLGQENRDVYAWIMLNDKHKVPLHGDSKARYGTSSQSIILTLQRDDQVWIQLSKESGILNDYSTFTGYLLFEGHGSGTSDMEEEEEISNHLTAQNYEYWRWRK